MNSFQDKIIFVPSCLLCTLLMAKKPTPNMTWHNEIISFLNDRNYSIIQMPCPEASFPNYKNGLKRSPHGIKYYEELSGFSEYCFELGRQVVSQIDAFHDNGFTVVAILGIEHSPTCAASYLYTHHGTQKRQGIFIKYMAEMIKERPYDIPIIGINRRYPNKAIQSLIKLESHYDKG